MSVRNACHLAADGFIPVVSAWNVFAAHIHTHTYFAKLARYKNILAIYMDFLHLCSIKKFRGRREKFAVGLKCTACLTFVGPR